VTKQRRSTLKVRVVRRRLKHLALRNPIYRTVRLSSNVCCCHLLLASQRSNFRQMSRSLPRHWLSTRRRKLWSRSRCLRSRS